MDLRQLANLGQFEMHPEFFPPKPKLNIDMEAIATASSPTIGNTLVVRSGAFCPPKAA